MDYMTPCMSPEETPASADFEDQRSLAMTPVRKNDICRPADMLELTFSNPMVLPRRIP
jgi:hypothetical protein